MNNPIPKIDYGRLDNCFNDGTIPLPYGFKKKYNAVDEIPEDVVRAIKIDLLDCPKAKDGVLDFYKKLGKKYGYHHDVIRKINHGHIYAEVEI